MFSRMSEAYGMVCVGWPPEETGEVDFRVFIKAQTSDESEHSEDSPRISKVRPFSGFPSFNHAE